jgi:hypothetical protein
MAQSRFNCFDVLLAVISLLTFLVDVGSGKFLIRLIQRLDLGG